MAGVPLVTYARSLTAKSALAAKVGVTTSGGVVASSAVGIVPVALPRLQDTDLQFTPIPPQFAGFVADAYGDLVTPGDGWESIVSGMVSDLGTVVGDLPNLAQNGADADFTDGQFESTNYTPLVQQHSTWADNYAALVAQYTSTTTPPLAGGGPPPPPPPPPPPGDGGGGGGGTGTGGGPPGPQPPCAIWGYDSHGKLIIVDLCQ